MRRAVVLGALCLASFACNREPSMPAEKPAPITAPEAQAAPPQRRESLLDAQGEPIGSGVELYGIELPKGLEPKPELTSKDTRVLQSRPPLTRERLEAYFGRRVVTATVEREQYRTAFRSATSAAHPESKQRFDVIVTAKGTQQALVSFVEHVPPPAKPYDVATVQRALRENQE